MNAIANTDALTYLRGLPAASIDCIVTSPPYFRLRDYGHDAQIGMEDTPAAYIARLMDVFDAAHAALKDSGTCWVNIGDSYNGSGKGPTGTPVQNKAGSDIGRTDVDGIPRKSLMLIPFRFALAMQKRGWIVRSDIVWAKGNPMPESVKDRPTRSHEYVFLLTKQPAYYYDADAIAEPAVDDRGRQPYGARGTMGHGNLRKQDQVNRRYTGFNDRYEPRTMRNRRDVWTINPKPIADAHFATMPERLAELMILAGCPSGGVVCDPFIGSGTTALAARKLGRLYAGCELNPDYHALALRRLARPYTHTMFALEAR